MPRTAAIMNEVADAAFNSFFVDTLMLAFVFHEFLLPTFNSFFVDTRYVKMVESMKKAPFNSFFVDTRSCDGPHRHHNEVAFQFILC